MKKLFAILTLLISSSLAFSQENMVTVSGGYVFANMEDTDLNATGWRINGLYEFNPGEGSVAHGFSIGYINASAEDKDGLNAAKYELSSWAFYYAPKFLFGNEKFKGFIKGALGMAFSSIERTGTLGTLSANDDGFVGGGGAGALHMVSDKLFLNLEYELLWMSNSYYRDGMMNTAMLGIGYKF